MANNLNSPPWEAGLEAARAMPRCGAKTRRGTPCRAPGLPNGRCWVHGGPSPGAPCGERNGNYKHGRFTKAAREERRLFRLLLWATKATMTEMRERV